MDKLLGLDYGKSKVGISIGNSWLAEPYKVIRYFTLEELINRIILIVDEEDISKIVVGDPGAEGKIGKDVRLFVKRLADKIAIPIYLQDEALSTHLAKELSIAGGLKRKKRKQLEDAYAAVVMLQSYLDKNRHV